MRKALLFIFVLAISVSGFSQNGKSMAPMSALDAEKTMDAPMVSHWHAPMNQNLKGGPEATVLYYEGFANGLPSSWTNVAVNNTATWEYRGPTTTPNNSVGSRGAYATGLGPIGSPSKSDGFMIFDSDYYDNAGITNNFGGGPHPVYLSGNVLDPHIAELTSGSIDLTGYPDVRLEWYQYYRNFDTHFKVLVSGDNGATWDTVWNNEELSIYEYVDVNERSDTADLESVDISSVAGNQSNVKIRFLYDGSGDFDQSYYFWMIDDVSIITNYDNDLVLDEVYIIQDPRVVFYGHIPLSQIGPLSFSADVINAGEVDQTNTVINLNITRNGSSVFTGATSPVTVSVDDSTNYAFANTFTPTQTGEYIATFTLSSDSTDERSVNNTWVRSFYVTDSTFALDRKRTNTTLGTHSFASATSPTNYDGMIVANYMQLTESDWISSLTLGVTRGVGGSVKLAVRDTTTSMNTILETDIYTITAQDSINGYLTVPIDYTLSGGVASLQLPADDYYISAELFSNGGANRINVRDDESVWQFPAVSIIFLPQQQTWYTNGNAFHIRMNLHEQNPIGIEDKALGFNFSGIYPNPSAGTVNFAYEIAQSATVEYSVRDLAGREIYRNDAGKQAAGKYAETMNFDNLSSGIYFFELKINEESISRKFIINR